MNRRTMLSLLATAALAGVAGRPKPAHARVAQRPVADLRAASGHAGPNLENWHTCLGDSRYPAGEVVLDDVGTEHVTGANQEPAFSLLCANVEQRPVMAHNITYLRRRHDDLLGCDHHCVHHCGYDFRIPFEPVPDVTAACNAETLEGGFFIWDGSARMPGATQPLDYGVAFQIILNPWLAERTVVGAAPQTAEDCAATTQLTNCHMGDIRLWTGSAWENTGLSVPIDTAVHHVAMTVDLMMNTATIEIDDICLAMEITATPKTGWGAETDARLQVETINAFPGCAGVCATSEIEISNWYWHIAAEPSTPPAQSPSRDAVAPPAAPRTGSSVYLPLVSPPHALETPVSYQTVESSAVLRWAPAGVSLHVHVYKDGALRWASSAPLASGCRVDLPDTGLLEIRLVAPDGEAVCDAVPVWCIAEGAAQMM